MAQADNAPFEGKVVIFSAPSGSGKTTIVKHLNEQFPNLGFSISATTRPPRKSGEIDGKDYFFLTADTFSEKITNNEFIEWEEVYPGIRYGTLRAEIDRLWNDRKHVLFDVDVKGGLVLKKYFGERALAVYVKVSDLKLLADRLKKRGADSIESIQKRLEKAEAEAALEPQFDITLINDDLSDSLPRSVTIVKQFLDGSG